MHTSKLRLLLYSNDDSLLMSAHKTFMTTNPRVFLLTFDEYRKSALACLPDLFLLTEAVITRLEIREVMEPWKPRFDIQRD